MRLVVVPAALAGLARRWDGAARAAAEAARIVRAPARALPRAVRPGDPDVGAALAVLLDAVAHAAAEAADAGGAAAAALRAAEGGYRAADAPVQR